MELGNFCVTWNCVRSSWNFDDFFRSQYQLKIDSIHGFRSVFDWFWQHSMNSDAYPEFPDRIPMIGDLNLYSFAKPISEKSPLDLHETIRHRPNLFILVKNCPETMRNVRFQPILAKISHGNPTWILAQLQVTRCCLTSPDLIRSKKKIRFVWS